MHMVANLIDSYCLQDGPNKVQMLDIKNLISAAILRIEGKLLNITHCQHPVHLFEI